MALVDVVKYQTKEDEFIYKFPSEDLRIGTHIVVSPAQHAFFVKEGQIHDEFNSGTHVIKTENIPLLNRIINLPFGGNSPFQAEVWYVNLLAKLNTKWGTSTPILLEDPKYGVIVPVRAFGQYGFKISNPRRFLENLSGNLPSFTASKIQDYFKGKVLSSLTTLISRKLVIENVSILEINVLLDELSSFCQNKISEEFKNFGIEVINFYFISINVPEDDTSVIKLKEAKDLAAKLRITGKELYQMDRSFDVLDQAAKNEGGLAGGLMGAGLGLGLGAGIGNKAGNIVDPMVTKFSDQNPPPPPAQYFLYLSNQQEGPLTFDQVKQLISASKINGNTLAWKDGLTNWIVINQIEEFSIYFRTPPPIPQ